MSRQATLSIGPIAMALAVWGCTHSWVVAGTGPAPKVSVRSVDVAQQLTVALERPAYLYAYRWEGGLLRVIYAGDSTPGRHAAAQMHRFVVREPAQAVAGALPAAPAQRLVYYCPSGIVNDVGVEAPGPGCGWFLWAEGEHPALWSGRAPGPSNGTRASAGHHITTYLVVTGHDVSTVDLERAARSVDVRIAGDPTRVGQALVGSLLGVDGESGSVVYVRFP